MKCITFQNITKKFDTVQALTDITLTFLPGEVHALLGENGAGKSTLASLLAGIYQPDAGDILINEKKVGLRSPSDSLQHGIGMVHQHPVLVPELSLIENMMLRDSWWKPLNYPKALRRFHELADLLHLSLNPKSPVKNLALGERQQVEILRALWYGQEVLVFDEPTSLLAPSDAENLGATLMMLAKNGYTVLFITHKLHEALSYADRISILCKGKKVGEIGKQDKEAFSEAQLTEKICSYMFGAKQQTFHASSQKMPSPRPIIQSEKPLFFVDSISTQPEENTCHIKEISFSLYPNEILGIAGIDGNGQKHLAEALAGQRVIQNGNIVLKNTRITQLKAAKRQALGIQYVSDDRLNEGIAATESIALNFQVKKIGAAPFWKGGFAQWKRIYDFAKEKIQALAIQTHDHRSPVGKLSGGTIQKIILARELGM